MYAFDTHTYALDTPTVDPTLDTARTRSNTLAYALDAPALDTHVHAFNICVHTTLAHTCRPDASHPRASTHMRATQACMQMQEVWNGGREGMQMQCAGGGAAAVQTLRVGRGCIADGAVR